jgi:hypothetical protein
VFTFKKKKPELTYQNHDLKNKSDKL